jgi:DNA-binding transcriptional LysR family regulator
MPARTSEEEGAAMLCWDDLRFFLAVARTGSTESGARVLKVSQTTAARRVAALEAALSVHLFERRQAGYALTAAGEALVVHAEAVEQAATAFAEAAAAQSREARGTVRLTAPDIYGVTLLPPLLRDLHAAHPNIRIELDTSDAPRDLGAGEADVALRVGDPAKWTGVFGRRIALDPWTIYCSRDYAARHTRPRSGDDLRRHPIIGGGGARVWPAYRRWLQHFGLEDAVAMEHGTTAGLLAAVRSGFGMAILPSFFAGRDPDLVQCIPPPPREQDRMQLWLLASERLRHEPRVRAVMDFLTAALVRQAKAERSAVDESAWAMAAELAGETVHPLI